MRDPLKKIKKLRGRSFDELRVRGAQALAAFSERRGWSAQARVPGDAEFSRLLAEPFASGARPPAESLLAHFRARTAPRFFASFDDVRETAAAWRRAFGPEAERELTRRADKIVGGRFDLLGFRDLRFDKRRDGGGEDRPAQIDWHLEPVAGKRAPLAHWSRIEYLNAEAVGDKKITWELNRHQHFLTLGRAYLLTGDERYSETFVSHLLSWADDNPPKVGINWASSLEVAFRAISWLWALHFFRESPRLTPAVFSLALKFLHLHARHLETYLSTYFSPNTHLTGEALGLFYLGALLPELRPAARWREAGLAILRRELARHVRGDGVYFEQSSYYHRYTADFYTHLVALARRNDLASERAAEEKLVALLDHLMFITRPDGRSPLFGDDDGGRLAPLDDRPRDDFRAALSTGAVLFDRADYKFVARDAAEETLWLTGARGLDAFASLRAREPAEASRAFAEGGYYVMRDGWRDDSNYLILDCGPHGGVSHAHAHADALSFELAARGRALLVDPGTFTYTASAAERDRFRTTAAHNALVLDGEPSSEPGGAFSWGRVAQARPRAWTSRPRFDYFAGEHDGYQRLAPPAAHGRAVFFLKGDYFIVRDRVTGRGARRAQLYFHFAPGARPAVETGGDGTEAVRERPDAGRAGAQNLNGAGLEVFTFGGGGRWREEGGWVSRCYGARERAPVFVYEAQASGAAEFFTFLVPRAAAASDAPGESVVRRLDATGGQLFEVSRRGAAHYDVLLASAGAYAESGRLASDFEWTWARFSADGSTLEELVLVNGRRFSLYDQEIVKLSNRVAFAAARREGNRLVVEAGNEKKIVELGNQYSAVAER